MTAEQAVVAVLNALAVEKIDFMLVGSLPTNDWGIPRSTNDADVVLELGDRSMTSLARRLGPEFRLDPRMTFETVTATTRHEIYRVGDPFKIEFFNLSRDDHDQTRFRQRVSASIFGQPAFIPTAEDVIITKLR